MDEEQATVDQKSENPNHVKAGRSAPSATVLPVKRVGSLDTAALMESRNDLESLDPAIGSGNAEATGGGAPEEPGVAEEQIAESPEVNEGAFPAHNGEPETGGGSVSGGLTEEGGAAPAGGDTVEEGSRKGAADEPESGERGDGGKQRIRTLRDYTGGGEGRGSRKVRARAALRCPRTAAAMETPAAWPERSGCLRRAR